MHEKMLHGVIHIIGVICHNNKICMSLMSVKLGLHISHCKSFLSSSTIAKMGCFSYKGECNMCVVKHCPNSYNFVLLSEVSVTKVLD